MLRPEAPAAPAPGPAAEGSRLATAEPPSAPPAAAPPPPRQRSHRDDSPPGATTSPLRRRWQRRSPPSHRRSRRRAAPADRTRGDGSSARRRVKSAPANVAVTHVGRRIAFEVWDGSRLMSRRGAIARTCRRSRTARRCAWWRPRCSSISRSGSTAATISGSITRRRALGTIEIRAARGDCKAMIGKKDLGLRTVAAAERRRRRAPRHAGVPRRPEPGEARHRHPGPSSAGRAFK